MYVSKQDIDAESALILHRINVINSTYAQHISLSTFLSPRFSLCKLHSSAMPFSLAPLPRISKVPRRSRCQSPLISFHYPRFSSLIVRVPFNSEPVVSQAHRASLKYELHRTPSISRVKCARQSALSVLIQLI